MSSRPDAYPYEAAVRDLLRTLSAAQREITSQIEDALRHANLARAAERRAQLARLVALLDQIGADVDPRARLLVAEAHAQGAARAATQIAGLSVTAPEIPGAFTAISAESVAALQDATLGRLRDARRTVGRTVNDVYARAGRRAALRAVLGAEGSPVDAARQLRGDLMTKRDVRMLMRDSRGAVGFVDKAGKRWGLDTYSEMVVRTTTREAVVQGAIDRMASHGINLARVSMHASSCKICTQYEGRLVSLDGAVTEYEGETVMDASAIPPYHPNCAHSLQPVTVAVESFRRSMSAA